MRSYKLYLLYDLSAIGRDTMLAVFLSAFMLQVFMNSIIFGVLFLMASAILPILLSYILVSWKFQDTRLTEYFFSLPLSRTQIILSGFFLTFTGGLAMLIFCILVGMSGIPDMVQQYITNTFGGDFYVMQQDADKNIIFKISGVPVYFIIIWISSCFGWLPFLVTGAGLKRIITGIFSYSLSLGTCGFALAILYYRSYWMLLTLPALAIFISAVFVWGIHRFKKVQLFY